MCRFAGAEPAGIENVSLDGEPFGHSEPPPPPGAGELFQRGHLGGRLDAADAGTTKRAAVLSADHAVLGVPSPTGRAVQRHVQQHSQPPVEGQTARFRFRRLSTGRLAGLAGAQRRGGRRPGQRQSVVVVVVVSAVRRPRRRPGRSGRRRKFRQRRHADARLT